MKWYITVYKKENYVLCKCRNKLIRWFRTGRNSVVAKPKINVTSGILLEAYPKLWKMKNKIKYGKCCLHLIL